MSEIIPAMSRPTPMSPSEIAVVRIIATVMVRLRRSPVATSERTKLTRMDSLSWSAVDPLQQQHDPLAGLGVEVAGGLVGEQDQRPVDERAGDRHPLLLTTGELVRQPVGLAVEADHLQHLGHDPLDGALRLVDHLER